MTVTYTDGTSSKATVAFSDWTLNGGSSKPLAGDTTAVTASYRSTGGGGKDGVKTYVFATKVPLHASKQVASITRPALAVDQAQSVATPWANSPSGPL
ncbi:hypothetical protein P3G67_34085 [Streptomyces sp. RB6PN23]|uniref:Uncharacterized protein n=1 Tax=Streptomyces silvisoli TaxID=3034235 RepID=A0ABT5ZWE5_9ACTN|nr:hypothetical protein [Streptomyces silvisoli]